MRGMDGPERLRRGDIKRDQNRGGPVHTFLALPTTHSLPELT